VSNRTVRGSILALVAFVTVLAAAAAARATETGNAVIDPGTTVNGMLVVQGTAQQADASLFGVYCDPVVLSPGRRTRQCGLQVPRSTRLFVGHGVFAAKQRINAVWNSLKWDMWIDGQHVDLVEFGTTDRWLLGFAAADYTNVVLREWSIVLMRATGRHSIRYRTRWPSGVMDTTWRFSVAA
jgi:hypothetical protein